MIGKNSVNHHYLKKNDYAHEKRVCKDLEIKNLGEYHDLHFKAIHYC